MAYMVAIEEILGIRLKAHKVFSSELSRKLTFAGASEKMIWALSLGVPALWLMIIITLAAQSCCHATN
jgi:hypothetical protein